MSRRDQIAEVLNGEGAFCGQCEREPGDTLEDCQDCMRCIYGYADALLPLFADDALASVLRKLLAADPFLSMDSHDRSGGRPVWFTIDDTSVAVTPAEEAALKKEIGW